VDNIFEVTDAGTKPLRGAEIKSIIRLPSPLLKSNESFTKVVQVSYTLNVEAITVGCHMDVDMKFPIVVGSVPLLLNHEEIGTDSSSPSSIVIRKFCLIMF
jgi:hypothetical protein